MSWIEEKDNRIFNEDTITKPWYAEQFIKLLDYLIVNGVEEFARFSKEADNLSISKKNCLRMIQVFSYQAMGPIKEKWKELLEKYPHIKKFLKDNDMIDKRELCSGLYYYNLFKNLSENPNLAKIFKERLEKIKYLNANICWYPFKNSPFAIDGNGLFPWVSLATYDITDEDEKLIFLKKYYCCLDLEYHLLYSRFIEKNGRKYRHDIYSFQYENAAEKEAKYGYNINQGAGHGWILQVINNGKNIKKLMHLQVLSMANVFDNECHNLPSLEEVEKFDLTDEMKNCKTDEKMTKLYLKHYR